MLGILGLQSILNMGQFHNWINPLLFQQGSFSLSCVREMFTFLTLILQLGHHCGSHTNKDSYFVSKKTGKIPRYFFNYNWTKIKKCATTSDKRAKTKKLSSRKEKILLPSKKCLKIEQEKRSKHSAFFLLRRSRL